METLFLEIVNMSIRASAVALVVMALRFIFRKAPKWIFCLLWAMVGFRLIFPFSIQSEWSVARSSAVLPDDFIYAAEPVIDSGVEALDAAVNERLEDSLYTPAEYSANRTQVLAFICSGVWLLGVSAMLLHAAVSSLILKRRMATATILRGNIKQSEYVTSPFVMGIFRPTIYLPYNISEADREQVILHEQAHIQRCDHLVKVLAFALLSVHWFNPLIWISYMLLCRDMEKACDEKVISSMQEDDRRTYASALLNCAAGHRLSVVSPLAFGEIGVKNRIVGVMKYKKPALWLLIVVLAASALAAVCLLTDPVEQHPMYSADDPETAEVTYVPSVQNAADTAASAGEMLVIYCPAEPKEGEGTILIGGAVCNEVSEYLLTREWSKLSRDLSKASPGSIEFVISDLCRVTVYDSRVASVEYGAEEQWYRTGWSDYEAALELVHEPPHTVINEPDKAGGWIKCTLISDVRTVYLELGEYNEHPAEESIVQVQMSPSGSILLYPDWETEELTVSEHYYRRDGDDVYITKQTHHLTERNEGGAYVLLFEHRGYPEDHALYYVQGENGVYVFKLIFAESSAAPLKAAGLQV